MAEYPDAALRVYAIWFNVIASDDRSGWTEGALTDERVLHIWDEKHILGEWFPQQQSYREHIRGDLAWDIYFLYGAEARWQETPEPLIDSGSPIISKRDELKANMAALLAT